MRAPEKSSAPAYEGEQGLQSSLPASSDCSIASSSEAWCVWQGHKYWNPGEIEQRGCVHFASVGKFDATQAA
jgi:hypothetical protein